MDETDDEKRLEKPFLDQLKEVPVGYKSPPREGQWKPGQSGNPGGRPKWKPMSDALAKRISEEEIAQVLADKLIHRAGNGDVSAWREIADRLEGKVAHVVGGSTEHGPIKLVMEWDKE